MKKQKDRATAMQFDRALLEQIKMARNLNGVTANSISVATAFCLLVEAKLFGDRGPSLRSQEFNDVFGKLVRDAQAERAAAVETARKKREKRELDSRQRIVLGND